MGWAWGCSSVVELSPSTLNSGFHCKIYLNQKVRNESTRAVEITQWVKVLASKPEGLSSIPGTRMIEGRRKERPFGLHECPVAFMHPTPKKNVRRNEP